MIALAFLLALVAPSAAAPREPVPAPGTTILTILHTSEHHGTALPLVRRGAPRVAGMAPRATLIESIRREAGAVLLVDSGDILIGSALSSFFRGEPDIKAMNLMRYDAMAAGNHDFDFGLDHLATLDRLAQFPILCSNVRSRGGALPCRPSALVRVGDLTIGLISLLGRRNFPDSFNRQVVRQLSLEEPAASARRLATRLRTEQHADLVVAVTHQETPEDLALLATVPEVDVIVGGHTEGFDGLRARGTAEPVGSLADPGPVFVKTHRQGRTLGQLDLTVERRPDGTVAVRQARARNLPVTEALAPAPAVHRLVQGYRRQLRAQSGTVLGRSLVQLDGDFGHIRARETNLGNLLADILRARFETDVALVNAGQIRDSIPPGPVDVERVLRVLPFDSPMVTFSVRGLALRRALENSVSRLPRLNGRFLQVSGITVTYDLSSPVGERVVEVLVGEHPLDPARAYSVATDSFLADGGDGYTMFESAQNRFDRQVPMRDLLLEALRAGPLKASVRGRIRFLDSGPAGPGFG